MRDAYKTLRDALNLNRLLPNSRLLDCNVKSRSSKNHSSWSENPEASQSTQTLILKYPILAIETVYSMVENKDIGTYG